MYLTSRPQTSSGTYIASSITCGKQFAVGVGFGSGTETNVSLVIGGRVHTNLQGKLQFNTSFKLGILSYRRCYNYVLWKQLCSYRASKHVREQLTTCLVKANFSLVCRPCGSLSLTWPGYEAKLTCDAVLLCLQSCNG